MQTRFIFLNNVFSPSLTSNISQFYVIDFLCSEIFILRALFTWSSEEESEVGMLRPGGRPWRPGGRPRAPGGRPGRPGGPFTRLARLAAWPAWAWAWSCISLAMSGLWPPATPPPPPEEPMAELRSAMVTWDISGQSPGHQISGSVCTCLARSTAVATCCWCSWERNGRTWPMIALILFTISVWKWGNFFIFEQEQELVIAEAPAGYNYCFVFVNWLLI